MAFVRRKGNAYYLVHNVRRRGKIQQLHLARLGETPRITDEVVSAVTKKHPFVDLNWNALRQQVNDRVDLLDPNSPALQKLVGNLRSLNLDLSDLFPPVTLLRIELVPVQVVQLARILVLHLGTMEEVVLHEVSW